MTRRIRCTALAGAAAVVLAGTGPATSVAATCGSFSTRHVGGNVVRASEIRTTGGPSCAGARQVIQAFYGQVIGSSGATVARGYDCYYAGGGHLVRCRSGSRKIRWREA